MAKPRLLQSVTMVCVFCKAQDTGAPGTMHERGWEWFTGYNPKATEVCPGCAKAKRGEVDDMRIRAYTPPPQGAAYLPEKPDTLEGAGDAK
jgi:hypothetical protein